MPEGAASVDEVKHRALPKTSSVMSALPFAPSDDPPHLRAEVGAPARGQALAEQAYQLLRDAIVNHQLLPGARLSVPHLAASLGISRSPAREAVARLISERLATSEPQRGAAVARIDFKDLVEIYELREVLEGLVCRLAAKRIDAGQVADLQTILAAHAQAICSDDVARHMELDQAFHSRLRKVAGNARLATSLDQLQGQIRLAMGTTHESPGGMKQALREHRRITASLRRGDAAGAEVAARDHISRLRQALMARIDSRVD